MFGWILSFCAGIFVSGLFFQLSHIANKKSEEEIERISRETNSLRYVLLNWIIKTSKLDNLNSNDDKVPPSGAKPISGKYYTAKNINERVISYKIIPYFTNFWIQILYVSSTIFLVLSPLIFGFCALTISGIENVVLVISVLILGVIISFFLLTSFLNFFTGPMEAVKIRILDGKISTSGGSLRPIEKKQLRDVNITKNVKFQRYMLFSKIPGFGWLKSFGVGLNLEDDSYLLSHSPKLFLKWFGGANLKNIEDLLNKEIDHWR